MIPLRRNEEGFTWIDSCHACPYTGAEGRAAVEAWTSKLGEYDEDELAIPPEHACLCNHFCPKFIAVEDNRGRLFGICSDGNIPQGFKAIDQSLMCYGVTEVEDEDDDAIEF